MCSRWISWIDARSPSNHCSSCHGTFSFDASDPVPDCSSDPGPDDAVDSFPGDVRPDALSHTVCPTDTLSHGICPTDTVPDKSSWRKWQFEPEYPAAAVEESGSGDAHDEARFVDAIPHDAADPHSEANYADPEADDADSCADYDGITDCSG